MFEKWFSAKETLGLKSFWLVMPWWPSDTLNAKQRGLLRLLALAHRESLDLKPLIDNYSREHRGRYRRKLTKLLRRLENATPIISAIEQVPDVIRDQDLLALQVAAKTGSLDSAYDELLGTQQYFGELHQGFKQNLQIYTYIMAVVFLFITSFITTFIFPVLQQMNKEFGMELDGHSLLLIEIVDYWINQWLGLFFLAIFVSGFLNWSISFRRVFRNLVAYISPRIGSIANGEILDLLALALMSGRPATAIIPVLASHHFDRRVRYRLQMVNTQSDNLWAALSKYKILSAKESEILGAIEQPERLVWCLREFADRRRYQLIQKRNLKMRLLHPLITMIFAILVLLLGSALLRFLAEMSNALATAV